jgi:putative ABC transport system permease protein
MPVIVTLVSAAVGNILGYTVLKNVVVAMYYGSYSLPTYETIWNGTAFFKTTLIPVVLMFVVNLIVIVKMMEHTPLQFLRHDLKKTKRKKAMRLPRWSFLGRFRLRIIFQNVPNYVILFFGILFVMVMLAMSVGIPSSLNYYKKNVTEMMIARYQYVLKDYEDEDGNRLETENEDAEEFSMCSLEKISKEINEEVSVYGVSKDSRYIEIDDINSLKENEVYISEPFGEKYDLKVGDDVTLDEKYGNQQYTFKIVGIYDKCESIAVFMPIEKYRSAFDVDKEEFTGYLSDTEITDISENNIATVITEKDITKMCDQLDLSIGSMLGYFQYLCIILSVVLIYLLTKIIIEKNETAISMTKILGYENGEIASLYLLSTTIIVILSDAVCVALGTYIMSLVWKEMMFGFSGWFKFVAEPFDYVKMFLFVFIGYLVVMFFDFRRIKRIPMDEALKNVE